MLKKYKQKTKNKKVFEFIFVIVIILSGFFAYFNSIKGEFLWDDELWVEGNPHIKKWTAIDKIFFENPGVWEGRKYNFYRPFQVITYAMDYSFWKLNPKGYHFTNISLHILVALAIYWLIKILFSNNFLSVTTSLLFVVHPVHTEAIAYISGRADSLAAVFIILSIICYIKYLSLKITRYFIITLLSYFFALLSKEYGLILPFLLIFYHITFKKKFEIKRFCPVIVISFLYILFRLTVFHSAQSSLIVSITFSFLQRLPGFFAALFNYIKLLILPFNLHMEYGNRLFVWNDTEVIMGCVILFFLLVFAFKKIKNNNLIFFSIFWFFITLLPQSNFFPINAYMAEHWLYLPSVGFFLVLAQGLNYLYQLKNFRFIVVSLLVSVLFYYSFLTIRQNEYWRNDAFIYERNLEFAPQSVKLLNGFAMTRKNVANQDEAIFLLEKASQIDPGYVITCNNLANIYEEIGNHKKAIELYKKAIELESSYGETYYNLAVVYIKLGKKEEAVQLLKKAVEINPYNARAYNNLGSFYKEIGSYGEAIDFYKKVIDINPDYPEVHYNLGIIYLETGEKIKAINEFKKAVKFNSNNPLVYNNLGNIYGQIGKIDEAVVSYKKAIELNPGYINAYNNLGNILSVFLNREEEAIELFKKAIEMNPNFADAHNNLAAAYYYQKQYDLAIEHCDKAIELGYKVNPKFLELLESFRGKELRGIKN